MHQDETRGAHDISSVSDNLGWENAGRAKLLSQINKSVLKSKKYLKNQTGSVFYSLKETELVCILSKKVTPLLVVKNYDLTEHLLT